MLSNKLHICCSDILQLIYFINNNWGTGTNMLDITIFNWSFCIINQQCLGLILFYEVWICAGLCLNTIHIYYMHAAVCMPKILYSLKETDKVCVVLLIWLVELVLVDHICNVDFCPCYQFFYIHTNFWVNHGLCFIFLSLFLTWQPGCTVHERCDLWKHWVIDILVSEGKFILIGRSELSFAAWEQKELSWVRAVLSQDFTGLTDNSNLSSRILIPRTVLKYTSVCFFVCLFLHI